MLQIFLTLLFLFNMSEARLPSNKEASNTKQTKQTEIANLSRLCGQRNITMDIMVKCLEAGYIMKVSSLDKNTKIHVSRLTGCDAKKSDPDFHKCLHSYLKQNPQSAQASTSDCWKQINEEDFKRCLGWSNVQKAELNTNTKTLPAKAPKTAN